MSGERRVGKHERRINHPAPAEVAEGVGDAERVLAQLNAYVDDVHTRTFNGHVGWIPLDLYDFEVLNKALRAAPSLSREEWGIVRKVIDYYLAVGAEEWTEEWKALRAKVREAGKS